MDRLDIECLVGDVEGYACYVRGLQGDRVVVEERTDNVNAQVHKKGEEDVQEFTECARKELESQDFGSISEVKNVMEKATEKCEEKLE